jgi:predicted ribosomally synthesized peptide with SipW-like signal peptide
MKKKILLSVLIVAAVSGITYTVTQAFFTDRETTTGSTFTVGTLDLSVGGENGTDAFVIEGIGASGDISGGKTWTITNEGTLPGRLFFRLANVVNYDNGCNEPEAIFDNTCGNTGPGEGELGDVITARILVDNILQTSSTLATANQDTIGADWRNGTVAPIVIEGGASKTFSIEWATGQDEYDNRIQSDSLGFDVIFDLEQINTSTQSQVNY